MAITHLIGLDVGAKSIKAVQLSRIPGKPSRYVVTEFTRMAVDPQAPLPLTLKDVINSRPFKTKFVAAGVSGKNVFVRHHNMTQIQDAKELKEAAKYEIGKFMAVQDVNELMYDCQKLEDLPPGEKGQKEMRALIAGVKRPHLETFLSTLESSGVVADIIDVDSCALGNAYSLMGAVKPDQVNPQKRVALVDVGALTVNVHIMKGNDSYFARESYKAGEQVTDAIAKKFGIEMNDAEQLKVKPGDNAMKVVEAIETVLLDLCGDIKSSIDYFEAQFEAQVDEILLTGGGAKTPGLVESLEKTLQKKITRWSPIEFLDRQVTGDSELQLKEFAGESAIALGLAARLAEKDLAQAN